MDRDGTPRSHDEDPLQQTGPFGVEWNDEPERVDGDLLSEEWTPRHDPAQTATDAAPGPADPEHAHGEGREPADDYQRPEGYAQPDDPRWSADDELEPDEDVRRGFLGSGWTGEDDAAEEKRSQNRRLVLAMVAIAVLAVAGGWIVSSSVSGSKPEAACSGACVPTFQEDTPETGDQGADPVTEPTTEPTATPEETAGLPSTGSDAAPTTSNPRETRRPTSRPSPTRTRAHSPQPSANPSSRPQKPEANIPDAPEPTPTRSSTPPPTTQAPQPAPTPTEDRGGLFDWLF